MFLPRVVKFLVGQQLQVLANLPPGGFGLNDIVHITSHCSWERVAKFLHVLLLLFLGPLSCIKSNDVGER